MNENEGGDEKATAVHPRRRGGALKFVAGGVALLALGLVLGRHLGAPSPGTAPQPAPGAQATPGEAPKAGLLGLLGGGKPNRPPCVLVSAEGDEPDDYVNDLRKKAPGWNISTSAHPGGCTPDLNVQVSILRIDLSRTDWDTIHETTGYGGALAIGASGLMPGPQLFTGVGESYDVLLDDFTNETLDFVKANGTGEPGRFKREIVKDGKTCVKLVGESEQADDDQARDLIQEARRWYIVGGVTRADCQPDLYIAHDQAPLKAGDVTEGYLVAFAIMGASPMPGLSLAWASDLNHAGVLATNQLMDPLPVQYDPSAIEN